VFSCRVFDILNKAQPSSKYKTRNENTQKISVFCLLLSTCTPPKRVRVWSTEILLLNKNRQNFTSRPIYMPAVHHLLFVNCPPTGKQGVFGRFCGRNKHEFSCRRIEINNKIDSSSYKYYVTH
jgi:hypothetical protein